MTLLRAEATGVEQLLMVSQACRPSRPRLLCTSKKSWAHGSKARPEALFLFQGSGRKKSAWGHQWCLSAARAASSGIVQGAHQKPWQGAVLHDTKEKDENPRGPVPICHGEKFLPDPRELVISCSLSIEARPASGPYMLLQPRALPQPFPPTSWSHLRGPYECQEATVLMAVGGKHPL